MRHLEGKRAVLYSRVSTSDQRQFGNSLTVQQTRLQEFCSKHSIKIVCEFQEDCSAKDFNRPEFQKLNKFVRKNKSSIDFVLVLKWDRFSRSLGAGLNIIKDYLAFEVEINAIDEWRDYSNPMEFLASIMSLGMSEFDNIIKSSRTIDGNRMATKEGRYPHSKPIGYKAGTNVVGKHLMKPSSEAPLITSLFEDFASGIYSQSELVRDIKYKDLNLNRSKISRILTNVLYTGKIPIKAYKDEPASLIDGAHVPLITMDLYNKAQYQIAKRSGRAVTKIKSNSSFPLRGLLECKQCGGNITGSASRSKTGAKHNYYHCQAKKGCKERFRANDAHDSIAKTLRQIKPDPVVCDLFKVILDEKVKSSNNSSHMQQLKLEQELIKREQNKETILTLLMDRTIDAETYKSRNDKIAEQITELNVQKLTLDECVKDISKLTDFGVYLFKNLDNFFEKGTTKTKQKILSSILDGKLIFQEDNYRTPKLKEVISLITSKSLTLRALKSKKGESELTSSRLVPWAGIEPALPKKLDFESSASTSSATKAFMVGKTWQK